MIKEETKLFDSVEAVIQAISEGEAVIVTDDAKRENEGDLVLAAAKVTPEKINMMIRKAGGLICVPTTQSQLKQLGIQQMVSENRESQETNFTVSVDAARGITTGISAYDRAETIKVLANNNSRPDQLVQPGHIFPLQAKPSGVLQRAGHTEAAVDLAQLAGLHPTGVICEILNEDGSVARLEDLKIFKEKHHLKMISIAQLIEYRHKRENLVKKVSEEPFKNKFGTFTLHTFHHVIDGRKHIAFTLGKLDETPTLVRVQSENILNDIFKLNKTALEKSFEKIQTAKKGAIVYITCPNNGLEHKPDHKSDHLKPMNFRDYGTGAQILSNLGLKNIELLSSSNTQPHVVGLEGYGLKIIRTVPI